MKNIFMSAMVLALALMVGCSKDETPEQTIKYKVNFEVAERSQDGTRAIKQSWESGDQILIVFNDGTNWFDCLNNANTIKLTYDGSEWTSNVNITATLEGGRYVAFYHMGNIFFGKKNNFNRPVFTEYQGGEILFSAETDYTVNENVINLGTILLQRIPNDFQISVTDLTGNDWVLTIGKSNNSETDSIRHFNKGELIFWPDYVVKNVDVMFPTPRWNKAGGVQYGNDVLFSFRRVDGKNLPETLKFTLSNGTDTYTYTKTGVTNETLVGGKAYTLPAITDNRWKKL